MVTEKKLKVPRVPKVPKVGREEVKSELCFDCAQHKKL